MTEGERYYLRLLLLHRVGCTGFSSLKSFTISNGTTLEYPSFREAAVHLDLLESDKSNHSILTGFFSTHNSYASVNSLLKKTKTNKYNHSFSSHHPHYIHFILSLYSCSGRISLLWQFFQAY